MARRKSGELNAEKVAAAADVPASRYIPYSVHLSPGVIKLRENGDLCATWRLNGIAFETASDEQVSAAKDQLVNFLHSIRASDQSESTALWVHRVRRRTRDRLDGTYPSEFATAFVEKYWAHLDKTPFVQNELYFTLVLRPTQGASKQFQRARLSDRDSMAEFDEGTLERFEILCNQVSESMRRYGGVRLTCFERVSPTGNTLTISPMLTFFRFLLSGVFEDVSLQESAIYDYLCDSRIFAGDGNGIVQVNHPVRRTYIGYMDLLDYPEFSYPGMNNSTFYGNYEFIETQSFSFLGKRDGVDAIVLQQKRLLSSGEGSIQQIDDLDLAVEDVINGRVFMGEYHYTLGVFGDSVSATQKSMAAARTALQEDAGYKVATIDLIPECGFFAQLPGNWDWRPRQATVTSKNFACFAPLHNFDLGKRAGNPWGDAVVVFDTPSRQPFYFNFHQPILGEDRQGKEDPGNTFVCGQTGAGKDVFVNTLLTHLSKVPKLRGLYFDKDRGAEAFIRASGGMYRQLLRGQPTGFNPFQWDATTKTIKFVEKLVLQCARRTADESLPAHMENELTLAVRRVFMAPDIKTRRISLVLQFVGESSELGQRLSKWCRTQTRVGSNAWVLDNAVDTTDFSTNWLFAYDYTEFLGDEECGPIVMAYLLEAADTLLNGDPFFFVMNEFAKIISAKSPVLLEFARDKQTTIRKLNGIGIFITQSPSQLIGHPIAATIREQCVTQVFLANPSANEDDYVKEFKLSPTEFKHIKGFSQESRQFLVKQGERSAICRLNLNGFDDDLTVFTTTPATYGVLDDLREELGSDDPNVWLAPFLARLRERTIKPLQPLPRR